MKSILIISPEAWEAHTVSKHHYAMTLASMGAQVYFLNPPDEHSTGFEIIQVDQHPSLYVISAKKVAPGLRFFPSIIRRMLEIKWLKKLERCTGVAIDVIWLFENSRFFDLRFAGSRLKIYHQVDLNQNFNLRMAASTADICFCTTELIQERIRKFNSKVYKIHHGLAQQYRRMKLTGEQSESLRTGTVTAIYIGNLDMQYLDADLLYRLVNKFEDVSFHFIGGYSECGVLRKKVSQMANITWWGKIDSSLIPAVLESADILLVTYKSEYWRDQASPHKFMEYFDSGKTTVATYTDEYKDKTHLLEMVENSEDYVGVFDKVVNRLYEFNDDRKAKERMNFALDHTYEMQIGRIERLLRSQGLPALFES